LIKASNSQGEKIMSELPGAVFMDAKNGHLWALVDVLLDALEHRNDIQVERVEEWAQRQLKESLMEVELLQQIVHLANTLSAHAWHEGHLAPGEAVGEGHFEGMKETFRKKIQDLEERVGAEGFGL
jgi:hypothetical protein